MAGGRKTSHLPALGVCSTRSLIAAPTSHASHGWKLSFQARNRQLQRCAHVSASRILRHLPSCTSSRDATARRKREAGFDQAARWWVTAPTFSVAAIGVPVADTAVFIDEESIRAAFQVDVVAALVRRAIAPVPARQRHTYVGRLDTGLEGQLVANGNQSKPSTPARATKTQESTLNNEGVKRAKTSPQPHPAGQNLSASPVTSRLSRRVSSGTGRRRKLPPTPAKLKSKARTVANTGGPLPAANTSKARIPSKRGPVRVFGDSDDLRQVCDWLAKHEISVRHRRAHASARHTSAAANLAFERPFWLRPQPLTLPLPSGRRRCRGNSTRGVRHRQRRSGEREQRKGSRARYRLCCCRRWTAK